MKKFFLLLVLMTAYLAPSFAQNTQDIVTLKNGSVIRGNIIEQTPGESIKIQTNDGSIYVYQESDISKISKEQVNRNRHDESSRKGESEYFAKGYKGFIEGGYTFGLGDSYSSTSRIELSTTQGYQFNQWLFVGAGIGANLYFQNGGTYFIMPIFADVRTHLINGPISPFIDLKVGYSVFNSARLYLAPAVGCRFVIGDNTALNFSVGYTAQWIDSYYSNTNAGGVTLKLGFEF